MVDLCPNACSSYITSFQWSSRTVYGYSNNSSTSSNSIHILQTMKEMIWWGSILLSMPTILSFAENITEHVIITLGILTLLLIPLAFTKL